MDAIKAVITQAGFQRGVVLILGALGIEMDVSSVNTILTAVFALSGLIHLKDSVFGKNK